MEDVTDPKHDCYDAYQFMIRLFQRLLCRHFACCRRRAAMGRQAGTG